MIWSDKMGWLAAVVLLAAGVSSLHAADAKKARQNPADRVDYLLAEELNILSTATGSKAVAPIIEADAFIRRVSLDLIGQLPTSTEIVLFQLDPDPDKRAKLVDAYLNDARFGQNWGRYWRDVVLYRRVEDRALLGARAAEEFFTEAINNKLGWDEIAQAVI